MWDDSENEQASETLEPAASVNCRGGADGISPVDCVTELCTSHDDRDSVQRKA